MNFVGWLLTTVANAFVWAWDFAAPPLAWALEGLDRLVNPVLSFILYVLNPLCTWVGDAVYFLLSPFSDWLGLTVLSVVCGLWMMVMFGWTANQAGISRAKDSIKACLLELKLYKDYPRVTIKAQAKLLWALVQFQRHMLTTVLIMSLPMTLILAQMGLRYQWRSLRINEETLLRVRADADMADLDDASIESNGAMEVMAGPVAGDGDVVWRIRGREPGRHTLKVHVAGSIVEKELVVGERFGRVSAERTGRDWIAQLMHPAEGRLPSDSIIKSIAVDYPGVDSWIVGRNYWILFFFVVSMVAALMQKPLFALAALLKRRVLGASHRSANALS